MKICYLKRVRWCAVFLAFMLVGAGCASKPQKPTEAPPGSSESAPPSSQGKTPPREPSSPPSPSSPSPRSPEKPPVSLPAGASPPQNESYFTHTVKWSGETVSIIAAWYTGDLENWKILAEIMMQASPNADVNRILVGNRILIPERLLKTREPVSKEFVDSFYAKSKTGKTPSKAAPSPTEEEEPQLFGPKQIPKK